jgi:branched-chain amino acid transport system permease protein
VAGSSSAADVGMGRFERLPWRRIVVVVLGLAIAILVGIGASRTLSLSGAEGGYSADTWLDLTVEGVAQGAIYAMIALGYSLVYGILRMINFAHGEVFMAGAFGSFFFADAFAASGFLNRSPVLALLILTAVAVSVSVGTAVLLERLAYRPLRNAPRLVPLITAIGASLFLQNVFRGFFGPQPYGYPKPSILSGSMTVVGLTVTRIQLLVLITAVLAMVVLQIFVSRTTTGRAMRAVAQDSEIASLMGIDVNRVVVITFAIGGILAGVAALLFSLTFGQVQFTMGFRPGIAAFTAAVLGGIGSIGGAALGGFLIGLLRAVGPPLILLGYGIPSVFSIRDAFVFLILVLVLVFRPGGLLGTGEVEKV